MAQRVEDEDVDAVEQRPRRVGNAAAVGQVGEVAEAEAENRPRAVQDRHRLTATPSIANGPSIVVSSICGMPPPFCRRRVEDVAEGAPQVVGRRAHRRRRGIAPLLQHVEAAHFVQAHDVIGVAVREEDRVDARDAVRQRLLPQVGRGVDQDRRAVVDVDVDRRPQPRVARIGRPAHRARAADHRHAVRRAGAEERDARGCPSTSVTAG